jgi:hypothetical protein
MYPKRRRGTARVHSCAYSVNSHRNDHLRVGALNHPAKNFWPGAFRAEYESSIPFTRSNLINLDKAASAAFRKGLSSHTARASRPGARGPGRSRRVAARALARASPFESADDQIGVIRRSAVLVIAVDEFAREAADRRVAMPCKLSKVSSVQVGSTPSSRCRTLGILQKVLQPCLTCLAELS